MNKDRKRTDEELVGEMREYVNSFVKNRFTEELPEKLNMQIKEIVFDAFKDGMYFAEELRVGEKKSRIITDKRFW